MNRTTIKSLYRSMTMILNKISRYRSFHSRSSSSSYRYLSTTTTNPFAPDPFAHTLVPTAKQTLIQFIQQHSTANLALLSGAGLSTSSGIPDYRSEKGSYSKGHEPMQHSDFIKSPSKRKRFWARSIRGYKYFGTRNPNLSHHGFAALEQSGYLKGIVTQNVDRLHHAAGSQNVVELHGRGDQVACLSCDYKMNRRQFTENMEELNMDWLKKHRILEFQNETVEDTDDTDADDIRADGDSHLDLGKDFDDFNVPNCSACKTGILMPDLVFFGGSIKTSVKDAASKIIDDADVLMIFGSSCQVYSSYRLVRAAHLANKPILMINIGDTRVDPFVTPGLKFETTTDEAMKIILDTLDIET